MTATNYSFITGLNVVPATGEFTYDTLPHKLVNSGTVLNCFSDGSMRTTDATISLQTIKQRYPQCETINIVVSWFCDNVDASIANIFPSTIYPNEHQESLANGTWSNDDWTVAGITAFDPNLITIDASVYSGTPSDQSIIRIIQYAKSLGFKVALYPILMMTDPTLNRADITYTNDISSNALAAINHFVGNTTPSTYDASSAQPNWTYSQMILHYANICVLAGGVNLFYVGSGLAGLEAIRGPFWTVSGRVGGDGVTGWDYPFVAALDGLVGYVREVFDSAGMTKTSTTNLISYSADWTSWMGCIHDNGSIKIPHLDHLYANPNLDLISINNYLPLSDWTPTGGLDETNWSETPSPSYPPSPTTMSNLGLGGDPALQNIQYLQANIEGGEQYDWYYTINSPAQLQTNLNDALMMPNGDRSLQDRSAYFAGQNLLALKRLRWWWNNTHQAVYDAHDSRGMTVHGGKSKWVPSSKPITFAEYGFPSLDKSTNQPGSFYQDGSYPYWSTMYKTRQGICTPIQDTNLSLLALQAIYDYWTTNNDIVNDVSMIEPMFFAVWNWDIRSVVQGNNPTWDVAYWNIQNWRFGSLK